MKETIGNYIIESTKSSFTLNYERSSKNKFDILRSGITSILLLGFSIFLVIIVIKREYYWFDYFILIFCTVGSFWSLMNFILIFREPIKDIISYNNSTKIITIRTSLFERVKLHSYELKHIEYEIFNTTINVDKFYKRVYWIELHAITKSKKRIRILDIQTDHIREVGNEIKISELFNTAKPIVKKIADKLNVEFRYISTDKKRFTTSFNSK